jgi:hypothetical protein
VFVHNLQRGSKHKFSRSFIARETSNVSTPNNMTHSDGMGLISNGAMKYLVESLPFAPQNSADASIVQVRMGEATGTLTLWNLQSSIHLKSSISSDVLLPPSMIKFDADYPSIEVCKARSRMTYHLDRHVILLLLVPQGVPGEIFIQMQREIVEGICAMLRDLEKALELPVVISTRTRSKREGYNAQHIEVQLKAI